jgi:putative nucleotidyltransferase with HDIG domain
MVRATILFLDDEETVLTSLRSVFRREGYTLVFFRSGIEALAYLQDQSVDVIVADLKMPDISGAVFLEKAATLCPDAMRIILSGYEEKGTVLDTLARGTAQHYILKPWEDGAFRDMVAKALAVQRDLRESRLRKILGDMESLPSPPKFHVRLKALINNFDNPLKEIVGEIEKSPALVARVLRVANSVFYGPRRPIGTVREAVIFIGLEYVSGLVMAIEAFQNICRNPGLECTRFVEEVWDLSLHRARIAKAVAEKWPGVRDAHLPYVTALLMDIGYVVRICHDPEGYQRYQHLFRAKEMTKYEADLAVFGISHDAVGAALLQYWNFPPEVVDAVAAHHRKKAETALTQIVQVAEGVSVVDLTNPHDPSLDQKVVEWRRRLTDVALPQAS